MNSVDFCFWLQGYFEINEGDGNGITQGQMEVIANHLNLVFKHEIDPLREKQTTTDKPTLDATHAGTGNDPLVRC